MSRPEENLTFWRGMVGLDDKFPSLTPLREGELASSVVIDAAEMDGIRASMASEQLNQIIVDPGWGATTLFRHLVYDARDRVMERRSLPVAIDLATLFVDQEITPDTLVSEIRRQILGLLVGRPWESRLNRDFYFEAINYEQSIDLARHKADANAFLFGDKRPTDKQLVARFPWLNHPLSAQLKFLLSGLRIETALYVHLPPDMEPEQVSALVAAIKWITRDTGTIEFAAWREVYICTPELILEMERDFQRPYKRIVYKKYTAAQVYLMLIRRYQPTLAGLDGQRQINLTEVFDAAFVDEAWSVATSLANLSERVRSAVLRRLDCPQAKVPFRLEPGVSSTPELDAVGSFALRRATRERAGA